MIHDLTPLHLAAVSIGSALAAAVSFAVDGPTVAALVTAVITLGGALAKMWRASVGAAAEVQVLRMQVAEQARQIETLRQLLNTQADIIAEGAQ